MTDYELLKVKAQVSVLKDIAKEYPRRTIENVINNMEARIRGEERRREMCDAPPKSATEGLMANNG